MSPGPNLSILAHEAEGAVPTPQKPATSSQSKKTIILDPSYITSDIDALRFSAAAFNQLSLSSHPLQGPFSTLVKSSLLISSPYNNPGHYLSLKTLDTQPLLFSLALTALRPTTPEYATTPYDQALNLSYIVSLVQKFASEENWTWKEQSFYVVSFRSKVKEDCDQELLYALDYESHREACESGGLLKYWYGKCDGERRNLATCEFSSPFSLSLEINLSGQNKNFIAVYGESLLLVGNGCR